MRAFLVSGVLLAVTALPMQAHGGPGGHGGHGGAHGFRGHHGFRGGHHFLRQPFFAWGTLDWMDPDIVVVIPQIASALPSAAPIAAPPADPKFLFPPTPRSPSPAESHTVVVQRGSQIEVQSFPASR